MRVLVTGFEAFGGMSTNPTEALVIALNNKEISYPSTLQVEGLLLPVSFGDVFQVFQSKVDSFNPDIILSFGLASSRDAIELETLAVNVIHTEITDNKGVRPVSQKINPEGSSVHNSTLPLTGLEAALKHAGLPVRTSQSAGTYVCNYLFYRMMETNEDTLRLCGFIHVPPEKVLPLSELNRMLSVTLHYLEY